VKKRCRKTRDIFFLSVIAVITISKMSAFPDYMLSDPMWLIKSLAQQTLICETVEANELHKEKYFTTG
jgi:hypothetical protein